MAPQPRCISVALPRCISLLTQSTARSLNKNLQSCRADPLLLLLSIY